MVAKLTTPPITQALQSTTFTRPPPDGSLTLPEIYDWHLEYSPNHRLFVFSDDQGKIRTIYWGEAVRAIHNGARLLRHTFGWQPNVTNVPVVGILAMSDVMTYFTTVVSVLRAGYIVFPISPRNSASAVAHLVQTSGIQYILVGEEQSMSDLAANSIEALKKNYPTQNIQPPKLVPIPRFEELFASTRNDNGPLPYEQRGLDEVALYLHSSGSTGHPKPIAHTHRHVLELTFTPYFGERDLTDKVISLHVPLYHTMGFVQCCFTAGCGFVIGAPAPKFPAQLPTPDTMISGAMATHSDFVICVPSVVEAWSRNPEYVKWLTSCSGVLFGGGPLDKSTGDYMVAQGAQIFSLYGITEVGVITPFLAEQADSEWEYFCFRSGGADVELLKHDDNMYELILASNEHCHPRVVNTKVNGVDAYATGDILIPHPTKPGYWKLFGRADDQIMHSSGEKTNPGPLETILNQDPHVQSAVMFGRGKFQTGVIIDPKPEFRFDPSDEKVLETFRNSIWPSVQKMNAYAPQHSRLFKEMILVAKPDKPFQYTAKDTTRRQFLINMYHNEIEAMYKSVEGTTQANLDIPEHWNITSSTEFVRKVIGNILVQEVKEDDDIFQNGCDSLQATWIRNTLMRALRESGGVDVRGNTDNFVYDYPTISQLSKFLLSCLSGDHDKESTTDVKQEQMTKMVLKYSTNFGEHAPRKARTSARKTVLLTGSTGGLGAFVLNDLVADDNVEHIYCINRPSKPGSASLLTRQRDSFVDKGLPVEVLESKKVTLLGARMEEEEWGLEHNIYNVMHESVTHIIHNAWPVDFNLSLASFETNIRSLRSLIDFSLSSPLPSPATVIFTSTIGVFKNPPKNSTALQELPIIADVAINNGYTESKWVCEQIMAAASAATAIKTVTVRVGQICGGPNGFWSTKEWFPALVQSAKFVGCLPESYKDVSWIPVHVAAHAIVDFMEAPDSCIVHLAHPKSTSWAVLAAALSSELSVPIVPYSKWISKLESATLGLESQKTGMAALRLINLYRDLGSADNDNDDQSFEAFVVPRLDTTRASGISPSLAQAGALSGDDAKMWVAYWRAVGFM